MGSLFKEYSDTKLNGRVYTPKTIVHKILNDIGFSGNAILGKTILDPACGDGRFIIEIAKRIIEISPSHELKENLLCIYGWDINKQAVFECKEMLNDLINIYGITIDWNISVCNALVKKHKDKFDFIVGNPPYIRIQHLEELNRIFIQKNYSFCKSGSTDIYIAFFELCHSLLSDTGICGLITPNTYLYTETALQLRKTFATLKNVVQITNYGQIQLFNNATTYSAITIFKRVSNTFILYQHANDINTFRERKIHYKELTGKRIWQLTIEASKVSFKTKLKDIADIFVGITTLCDKAYIFSIEEIDKTHVWAYSALTGKFKIEKDILKPVIKASRYKSEATKINYVLFPYEKKAGKYQIIKEEKLKTIYPCAYKYLCFIKPHLDKRDNGKPNAISWYAFGRTQSLNSSFGKKILFSPMNNKPNFILSENKDATFYSGYCIKYKGDYTKLLEQLNSKRMEQFISGSSRDFRGGWKAYNKAIIQEFEIDKNEL